MSGELLAGLPETGLVAFSALSAFLVVLAIWYALVERDPSEARARMLARRQAEIEGATATRRRARRRQQLTALATGLADRLELARSKGIESVRERLTAAGLRAKEAVALYLLASLFGPVASAAGGLAMASALEVPFAPAMTFVAGGGLVGMLLPRWYVTSRLSRRLARLRRALPDALDLLVICAEAGLSLDASLHRVARELGRASPELADELALTAVELTFFPERRQVLHNLARRVPLPACQALVGTLVQTERYGTPLAPSLRVLANELREQRLIQAEEKAARLPAILTVPLIVFILPTLFVVLAGPAMIDIYDQLVNR